MKKQLILECLNGPLDGYSFVLDFATGVFWGKQCESVLTFPWDYELGEHQARFFYEDESWWLESFPNQPHGTYRLNTQDRVQDKIKLSEGDILKASKTWLRVRGLD